MEGNLITRDTVVSEWMQLRPKFMREDVVQSSFEKTGIYPLNPNVFTAEDFAPSQAFSIQGQLPVGYPITSGGNTEYESDTNDESKPVSTESSGPAQLATPVGASSQGPTLNPESHMSIYGKVKQEEDVTLNDLLPAPGTALNTKSQLTAEIIRLRSDLESCIAQRDSAQCRATEKINTKKQNGRKKLTTDARLVTSDKYISIRRKKLEEEEREAKKSEERAEQRRNQEARREKQRTEGAQSLIWSVCWRNKRKEDLKDSRYALEISMEGTREVLIKQIETHLAEKPLLANDNRFRALFASKPVTNLRKHDRGSSIVDEK
ncbi:hypothetical protein B0J17DRAFT_706801 [Rhizoctonia solani]|nr:hypothetical protein B0J17DRAFT_706801 [Rhizoctonia solani]